MGPARSLRARLTLWYTAALGVLLVVLGATALGLLERGLRDNVDTALRTVARTIAETSREPSGFGPGFEDALDALLGPSVARRFFQLLDPFGRPDPRLVPRGQVRIPLSVEAIRNAEQGRETFETTRLSGAGAAAVRVLTVPVVDRGRLVHLVQVALPLDAVEAERRHFLWVLVLLLPPALAAAGFGGWVLAGRALAPVDTMVRAARRIEAEDLAQRLGGAEVNDEIGRLAAVLNDMLARLERAFAAVRQFSGDAAHELRTPLTILKGELDVALQSAGSIDDCRLTFASCLEEVDRLTALVDDLLFLARADAGAADVPPESVDVSAVLADVRAPLEALAERAGVTLTVAAADTVPVRGHAALLFRAVFNLGDNAIKYCDPGGRVDLWLHRDGERAVIEVRDTGVGIPSEALGRVFDRFYRADAARQRGGTGLGLALVKSIVQLHSGEVTVESQVGEGSTFRIVLPAA